MNKKETSKQVSMWFGKFMTAPGACYCRQFLDSGTSRTQEPPRRAGTGESQGRRPAAGFGRGDRPHRGNSPPPGHWAWAPPHVVGGGRFPGWVLAPEKRSPRVRQLRAKLVWAGATGSDPPWGLQTARESREGQELAH